MSRRPAWIAALVCAISLATLTASAQTSDPVKVAKAQALYDEANKDMDARHYDVACPKLEQVIRLVPEGIGALITLAECYEGQGKLASAWVRYREAQAKAAQTAGQKDREKKARERAEALEGKLAKLTITVPEATAKLPDLVIQRDGEPLDPALWNSALPIDKGEHQITANARGKLEWHKAANVESDGESLSISVDSLKDAPKSDAEAPKPTGTAPPSAATPTQRPNGRGQSMDLPPPAYYDPFSGPPPFANNSNVVTDPTTRRIVGVALGVGGVGAGVGGAFLYKAGDKAADEGDTQGRDTDHEAGIGLMIGGGVVAVLGVIIFATAESYTPTPTNPKNAALHRPISDVAVSVGPSSIRLTGAF